MAQGLGLRAEGRGYVFSALRPLLLAYALCMLSPGQSHPDRQVFLYLTAIEEATIEFLMAQGGELRAGGRKPGP